MRARVTSPSVLSAAVIAVEICFWVSLAALVWTHVAYPAFALLLARVAPRQVHAADQEPSVAVIIAAYNEETVIARRVEMLSNLMAEVAVFLLSPRSSGINAQSIVVDAGMSINYFDRDLVRRAMLPE